jgi:processive 1,2-diacylglycerol beta-glucosyltransferase
LLRLSKTLLSKTFKRRRKDSANASTDLDAIKLPDGRMRVLILSADVGEGHTAAAKALAHDLQREDPQAQIVVRDGLRALGLSLRHLIRDGYRFQLRWMPWSYSALYFLFSHVFIARLIGQAVLALLGSRPTLSLVRSHDPDVVVSTHPAITSVLGHLRRHRRLDVPTCATITDLADYKLWAHPGIDLHLVMHQDGIAPVESVAGHGSVRCVRPLVAAPFLRRTPQQKARTSLGLPSSGYTVVVSGGGWGVGNLKGAVESALSVDDTCVVCLAGRNELAKRQLERDFAGNDRVKVFGFTERMSELLAAADCLVHSTGGVTSLEALACGCPLVAYQGLGGHARVHNRNMVRLGLAQSAESPPELATVISQVLLRPRLGSLVPTPGTPEPASLVMEARPRARQLPPWQPTLRRVAATCAATALIGGWGFSTDDLYPVAAKALPIRPVTAVATKLPEAGLVVRAPQAQVPAISEHLKQRGIHASFALSDPPAPQTINSIESAGDQALPELKGQEGLTRSLTTRSSLRREAAKLGFHHRFYYLVPRSGYTLGQYVASRTVGASPVSGAVKVAPGGSADKMGSVRSGEVVVVTLGSGTPPDLAKLDSVLDSLNAQGLSAVSLQELAPTHNPSATPADNGTGKSPAPAASDGRYT